ncbi:MAG TPA: flagellar motor switch protein FliM [Steroidobacteraceae bacterium]|nr:flagellar motor switch protein FliM [Steroidobacteraceae bacterium]
MSDVLNQDEIDALLHGVDSGAVDTAPRVTDSGGARSYDFSTQTRIVRGRMPTLEIINERFARQLRLSLYDLLRRSAEISVIGVSTQRYAEYVPGLAVPTSLNLIRFSPLNGTSLLIFEAKLVFALIDCYFGGSGRYAKIEGRDFTGTEIQMIEMLMGMVVQATQDAWDPVLPVKIDLINREMNPNLANIVSPTEVVVVSRFRIEVDGVGGEIHITFPYSTLEPLKDTLRAGLQSDRASREERWSQIMRNELEESEVDLAASLGNARVSLGQLLDMRAGDVLPIEFDGRATVAADGVPLFRGELGQQRGKQVVRVAQLITRKTGNALDAFARKGA